MRTAASYRQRPITSRALLFSIGLHAFLLLFALFVWREYRYAYDTTQPAVTVEFFAPRKPQSLQLRLKIEEPAIVNRGQLARSASVRADEFISPLSSQRLNLDREATVVREQRDLALPGTVAKQSDWTTDTDLPQSSSSLVDSETKMADGGGLGSEGPARPDLQPTGRASLGLEDMGDDDDDTGVPFLGGAQAEDLPFIEMEQVLRTFAESIVSQSGGGPIDVVFVIDYSGSMQDNIDAVQEHLNEMIEVYKRSGIDYALGLVQFHVQQEKNDIRVFQPTQEWHRVRRDLSSLRARGDEHAFDAIDDGTTKIEFRPASKRFFILATDEPFTSTREWKVEHAITASKEFDIITYVMGIDIPDHHRLADETDGRWHQIPQSNRPPSTSRGQYARRNSRRQTARTLRSATWQGLNRIRQDTLQPIANNKLDVLWIVDVSRSMEDKLPPLLGQIGEFFRAWDHALLDYQVAMVRFRSGAGSFDHLNFYAAPQSLDDCGKILKLPTEGSERLLDAFPESLQRMKWRSDAKRYVIVVTDEPSNGQNNTAATARGAARQGLTVSVVGTMDAFQQDVVQQTGGLWVPMPGGYTTAGDAW